MRVVALICAYNEELVLGACLENLVRQGVEFVVIDNESTDRTREIAQSFAGRGLVRIESLPRHGTFRLVDQLRRKEQLAAEISADWFMHMDADEIRLPPDSRTTLARAIEAVDARGFNAINFLEFTFIPVREAPAHEHAEFQRTMRWYYPFQPKPNHQLKLWKRGAASVDLVTHAGHRVKFAGRRIAPESFPMRHYQFLSHAQAIRKYVERRYDEEERRGRRWHGWRGRLTPDMVQLPAASELRLHTTDDALDATNPRATHVLADRFEQAFPSPPAPTRVMRLLDRLGKLVRNR